MDASTCYAALNISDAEYYRIFHQRGPSFGQWLACLLGAITDLCGIVYAYYTLVTILGRVKHKPRLPIWAAKISAIIVCVVAYILIVGVLMVVKKPRYGERLLCVWDYLIIVAVCKAIWRYFVGENAPASIGNEMGNDTQKAKNKQSTRKSDFVIRTFVWILIIAVVFYLGTLLYFQSLEYQG